MNANIALPPWMQKIDYGFRLAQAYVVYYLKVLNLCLLTPEGRADFRDWPFFVWLTLIAVAMLIAFVVSRMVNPSPRYRGKYIRGTRLVATRGYWWKVLIWSSKTLVIGKARWPRKLEPLHLLAAGSPGTGKSQAIHGVLDDLRRRGDLAIVTDVDGEALSRFAEEGDVLLNPLDERSVAWSPFAEMDSPADADRLAKIMIPDRAHSNGDWIGYCQALVSGVLRRLWEQDKATNEVLVHFLTATDVSEELVNLLQGLPVQGLFRPANERMVGSVLGIVSTHLGPYSYLRPDAGPKSWSIRRHIQNGQGWLWMPYLENQRAALRPLLAAWVGEAVSAMLSSPPDLNRRRWLLLDEVASLGCVQDLSDALTRGRKHGLCAILGLQSVAQLRQAYGDDGAQVLLSCLSSQLILRAVDPETARYASEHLGKCELERMSVTHGKIGETTRKRERYTEDLVLPSEIQALPDRRGYLRLAGQNLVRCVKIPLVKRSQAVDPFVPRSSAPPAPPLPAAPAPPSRPWIDPDAILGPER